MTTLSNLDRAVNLVIELEGGDKLVTDSGGLTKFGISKRAYPGLDIQTLTRTEAVTIYERDYWLRCSCDKMPWPLCLAVFDSAVNQGAKTAIEILQQLLGVIVDGWAGPRTQTAIQISDARELTAKFLAERIRRYTTTANWDQYGRGWMNRVARIVQECYRV